YALSLAEGGHGRLSRLASVAALGGSLLFRIAILGAGAASARRPETSLRFAQPDNLPRVAPPARRRRVTRRG
ncbi:MAG TPA: hypothetical protein VE684_01010, partial [Crenalkalicoccus sp.]|nr:hypothetical protein [Crenalkalicoccus sp.]